MDTRLLKYFLFTVATELELSIFETYVLAQFLTFQI